MEAENYKEVKGLMEILERKMQWLEDLEKQNLPWSLSCPERDVYIVLDHDEILRLIPKMVNRIKKEIEYCHESLEKL